MSATRIGAVRLRGRGRNGPCSSTRRATFFAPWITQTATPSASDCDPNTGASLPLMSRSGRVEDPHSSSHKRKGGSSTRPLRDRRDQPDGRQSRTLALLLGATFVIPFLILFTLLALEVRIGEGYFAYRYSPVRGLRTPRAFAAIAI